MPARTTSLKTLLSVITVVVSGIALAVSVFLIVITAQLRDMMATQSESVESLLLIDQIKSDLLDIDQSNDPRLRGSLGPRLRREFVDMNRHVSTPRESSVLAEAVGANERYLAAQSGSLPGVSARLLADTYAKVQALRGINLDQARKRAIIPSSSDGSPTGSASASASWCSRSASRS